MRIVCCKLGSRFLVALLYRRTLVMGAGNRGDCFFPKSSNVWDSLAEAHMKTGDAKSAKRYYEKSLKLDPTNEGAKEMLKKLAEGNKK